MEKNTVPETLFDSIPKLFKSEGRIIKNNLRDKQKAAYHSEQSVSMQNQGIPYQNCTRWCMTGRSHLIELGMTRSILLYHCQLATSL